MILLRGSEKKAFVELVVENGVIIEAVIVV